MLSVKAIATTFVIREKRKPKFGKILIFLAENVTLSTVNQSMIRKLKM